MVSENKSSRSESAGLRAALAPLHEYMLSLGRVLAKSLDEPIRAQLGVVVGTEEHRVDELRFEFRYAPSIPTTTVEDIRCAIVISEFCLAVEGLMLQDEKGPRQVVLSNRGPIKAGEQRVPVRYFGERFADAISFDNIIVAYRLFHALVALLQNETLPLQDFTISVVDAHVHIDHNGL